MASNHQSKLSPTEKAHHTATWARTMTKWLVGFGNKTGARWNVVDFGGRTGSESRGIVDLMAIRKNHSEASPGLKRGDLFEVVLIQTKGGGAARPNKEEVKRLTKVGKVYAAKVVLAVWKKAKQLKLFQLKGKGWEHVDAVELFGQRSAKKIAMFRLNVKTISPSP